MLSELSNLDKWPDSVKTMQKGWIGKSQGCRVQFKLLNSSSNIEVFTTRIDTLFGVEFLAISPESEQLESLIDEADKQQLENYRSYIKGLKAQGLDSVQIKEKSLDKGLLLQSVKVVHPVTN